MKRNEIIDKVKEAIIVVCRTNADGIKMTDKIKTFVPVIDGPNLAGEINSLFPEVSMTPLLNQLYDPISKVKDLVDYIEELV